ncbi:MAG TPA: protein kinase [Kofleriaceae bacterium]|nr:protein kinase [Kofleriaceae bacterium]
MVAPLVDPTSPLVGRKLGEFEVVERVAVGGFGELFRARQGTLGRDAVVKVLSNATVETARDRFTREAQLASQLDHPYAAHIYAFGVEPDGLQWIAMELVRGVSLAELLRAQGSLPVARFVPLFQAICQVVHVAHEQGIVHRDIKPSNVMVVARAGVLLPKLLDLGIARLYTADRAQASATDERVERLLSTTERTSARWAAVDPGTAATLEVDDANVRFDRQLRELLGERLAEISNTPQSDANLTSGAVYLGSPPYMAPELWLRPHTAGPPADIYALGVLAYECLTGKQPYHGATTADIARAHLQPLPALPEHLPPALHAGLLKATAKRAKDRHSDALALSRAVEEACRVEPAIVLPRPPDELVAKVFARAPQPIAESIAAAEASTRLDDAYARYVTALELVPQYLGIVALGCWTRLGSPDPDGEVRALVRRLCNAGLAARDWLVLAQTIAKPFTRLREAFPLPELVDICRRGLGEPAEARLGAERPATITVDDIRALIDALVAAVGELDELFEYQLAVKTERGLERWSGARRRPRPLIAGTVDAPDGAPVLIDRNGAAVVSLWPLAKPIAPTQTTEPELFFVAGLGRYGARLVAQPNGFSRQDPELAAWLEQLVGGVGRDGDDGEEGKPPYRGLASFSVADNELFFGRERESENLANHLRAHSFAAVVGPSGAGKSSFVQAGVVPLLPKDWRAVVMRPGASPFQALHDRLGDEAELERDVADPKAAMTRLADGARARGETLVLYVDQAEELVTLCRDERERSAFAQFLAAVRDDDRVRVVLTLRDDFLMRLQRLPDLGERLTTGMQLLGTPSRADLRRILVEPARRKGYELEDATLVEEMVGAVVDNPSALALLSFTAARLWELRDRQFRKLRRRVYASLGGVGGALAQHAEETIAAMADDERELVREAFRHLVTADGTRAVILKTELAELLGGGDKANKVIESLVNARLAVTSESSAGITVEITHEALLESWPRLVTWRREDAENARLRDRLRASARQWNANGRQKGMLWSGDVLVEYRLWRSRYPGRLADAEQAFANACLREEARGKRLRRVLTSTAFVVLAATAVVLYVFGSRARTSAAQAAERTIEVLEEQGRRDLLDQRPLRAARPLARAYAAGGDHPSLRFLLRTALRSVESQRGVFVGHTEKLRRALFTGDGKHVVTASDDGSVRLWDADSGQALATATLGGPARIARTADRTLVAGAAPGAVVVWRAADLHELARWPLPDGAKPVTVAISDDGKRVIVGDRAGSVYRLSADRDDHGKLQDGIIYASLVAPDGAWWIASGDGGHIHVGRDGRTTALVHGDAAVLALALHPDRAQFASGSGDGSIVVWSLDGTKRATLTGHTQPIRWLAFSPDGKRLASASEDATVRIWTLDGSASPVVLSGHEGMVMSIGFSPDGSELVSSGADGTVRLWDMASLSPLGSLDAHTAEVWYAELDATGTRIATASADKTGRVWEPWRGDERLAIRAPKGGFLGAVFDARGEWIATSGADGIARIVDVAGKPISELAVDAAPLRAIAFSPDRARLVTGSESGVVKLWNLADRTVVATLDRPAGGAYVARYRPDGAELAVAGEDGRVRIYSAAGAPLRTLAGHTAAVWGMAYSPDGALLATASDDHTARIWDARTGAALRTLGPQPDQVNGVAFDPSGTRVATIDLVGMLRVYRVADGSLLGEVAAHRDNVLAVAFSGDGERIATASFDHTVSIRDARTLRELARLRRHTGEVYAIAFHPTTDRLLSAGADGVLWLTRLELETRSRDEIARLVPVN